MEVFPLSQIGSLYSMWYKSDVFILPEGVGEGFHSIFGRAVSSTNERQSAQNTGHIYHPALALFQQWQKLVGHINNPYQVHIQNLCEILYLHPLWGADGYGPACIIHQTPQTCRWEEVGYLSAVTLSQIDMFHF